MKYSKQKTVRKSVLVNLDVELLRRLDVVRRREKITRSHCINYIVEEFLNSEIDQQEQTKGKK